MSQVKKSHPQKTLHNAMGMFDQLRGAGEMLKGMDPTQIKDLLEKAKESKGMMEQFIKDEVQRMIREEQLVTRAEVATMIAEALKQQ